MEYCIKNKIELIDGAVVYTAIGYITNMDECATINADFEATFGSWIESNKTELELGTVLLSAFFDVTPIVYSAQQSTDSVEGMGLTNITTV